MADYPKSKTHYFLYKSVIIIFVLVIFSYFPSQLPDIFKKTTILTKLWELIYLLVIGIAVCYGLFSRKIDTSRSDSDNNIDATETYLSGISQISSIFEDSESRNFLGEDEKYVFEQLGKPEIIIQNKPKSCIKDSSSGCWDDIKKGKFRGLVPIKLEDKFKETDSDSDSDSDSMRLGNETSHFRPVLDFDDIKSQSMRYSMSSEMKRSKEIMKDFGKNQVDDDFALNSNNNVPFIKSKSQRHSSATESSEMNMKAPIANTYKRGKSVRTNRLKQQVMNQNDDKVEMRSTGMNVKSDELSDSGEVDRKADEFIAKFKEQIRLQKIASSTTILNLS